LTHSIGL